jgi:hypothetical protein
MWSIPESLIGGVVPPDLAPLDDIRTSHWRSADQLPNWHGNGRTDDRQCRSERQPGVIALVRMGDLRPVRKRWLLELPFLLITLGPWVVMIWLLLCRR